MTDNNTTNTPEFKIVRRPVIFYEVSVMRGADGERRMFTTPISMNGTCGGCAPIDSGEKIIACVSPVQNTVDVLNAIGVATKRFGNIVELSMEV